MNMGVSDSEYLTKLEAENAKLRDEVKKLIDLYEGARDERDAALLQLGEAMKACPWATHSKDHTEPKHCIASLAALIEMRQTEKRKCEHPPERIGQDHMIWRCADCGERIR